MTSAGPAPIHLFRPGLPWCGSLSGGAHDMRIGASIFLIALGAILTFAVESDISGLDIGVIGVILMLAGALGLFMFMLVWGRAGARRRTTRPGEVIEVIEEQRGYEDPPL